MDQRRMHSMQGCQLTDRLVPFNAAKATWALNAAVWDFRFLAMMTPFLDSQQ